MARPLDPVISETLKKFGYGKDAAWDCHGTWVVYHKVLEQIAAKASISFDMPVPLETNGAAKSVALCVQGKMGERCEWSVGEASPANNKNGYPYAMAEKRAKDRVILKLIGLHGLAYSEEEADDFKTSVPPASPPVQYDTVATDEDIENGVRNFTALCRTEIDEATRIPELYQWKDAREAELVRLKAKHPSAWNGLKKYYQDKFELLSKKETVAA